MWWREEQRGGGDGGKSNVGGIDRQTELDQKGDRQSGGWMDRWMDGLVERCLEIETSMLYTTITLESNKYSGANK